jgi:GR25 family glycosyltransferase involved in LPS biosynthesis
MKIKKRKIEVLILSDIHLGTYGCHAKELLNYMKSIDPQLVILNGDVIDIWQFSKRYWPKSHMKVLRLFLESDDEYCVVLEDDVLFINEGVDFLKKLLNLQLSEIDILQFGYLAINGRLDSGIRESNNRRKERILRILKIFAVKTVSIFSTFKGLEKRIDRSRRILRILKHNEKLLDLNSPLVEGFEAGTHCYLINRKAASVLLNYNYPMLMGADLALIVLAVARNILITRTTSSYAIQDDSPVSIGEHSKLKLDLGTIIISAD